MVVSRYLYYNEGTWSDIQEISGFESIGWLMFAAEETADNSSWLAITSALNGTLAMGDASAVNLHFDGTYAQRGDQIANIVFTSNDPIAPVVKVPVKLHINEAPHFTGVPESIVMAEKETFTMNIGVIDIEGNTFTILPNESYSKLSYVFANGKLAITLTPDYGDAGLYTYTF